MPRLIKDRQIVDDDAWLLIKPASDGVLPAVPPVGDVIVPLSVWQESKQQLLERDGRLGVWLDSHEEPAATVLLKLH